MDSDDAITGRRFYVIGLKAMLRGGRDERSQEADVRDFDAVVRALDNAASQLGTVDVLVSGAAGNLETAVNSQSPNSFRVVVGIDLIGTFHVKRAGPSASHQAGRPGHRHLRAAVLYPDVLPGQRRIPRRSPRAANFISSKGAGSDSTASTPNHLQ